MYKWGFGKYSLKRRFNVLSQVLAPNSKYTSIGDFPTHSPFENKVQGLCTNMMNVASSLMLVFSLDVYILNILNFVNQTSYQIVNLPHTKVCDEKDFRDMPLLICDMSLEV